MAAIGGLFFGMGFFALALVLPVFNDGSSRESPLQQNSRDAAKSGSTAIFGQTFPGKPHTPGVRQVYDLYLRLVAPNVGKMVSSNREAYQYLNDSVKAFPEGEAFVRILGGCGYTNTRFHRLSLGICSLYTGEKQA